MRRKAVMDVILMVVLTEVVVTVDFDSFSKVLNRPGGFRDPGEPEEYCRGFQVFDKDMTGFIGVGQLRYSKSTLSLAAFETGKGIRRRQERLSSGKK